MTPTRDDPPARDSAVRKGATWHWMNPQRVRRAVCGQWFKGEAIFAPVVELDDESYWAAPLGDRICRRCLAKLSETA